MNGVYEKYFKFAAKKLLLFVNFIIFKTINYKCIETIITSSTRYNII